MKVGVFDSGLGGEIVVSRLKEIFPEVEFIAVNDRQNLPYGSKTTEQIIRFTDNKIQSLLEDCKIIIIACNTATAAAVDFLRAKYPDVDFIGFEPAIKPAFKSSPSGKVMVLATPSTLKSEKYSRLKNTHADLSKIIEPDCSDWAEKIDSGEFGEKQLDPIVKTAKNEKVKNIVLGCTHYLAEEDAIKKTLPEIKIETPIAGVANRLKEIMLKYSYASSEDSRD